MTEEQPRGSLILVLLIGGVLSAGVALVTANHNCNDCHTTHNAPGPSLLVVTDVEAHCLSCHGPGATGSIYVDITVHTNKDGSSHLPFSASCIDCHTPHAVGRPWNNWTGGTNIKRIGRESLDGDGVTKIITTNSGIRHVVFASRGTDDAGEASLYSFADNNEDGANTPAGNAWDGICEVCHTAAGHHTNHTAESGHYAGETCTRCHTHTDRFAPAGGSCQDPACHGSATDNGDGLPSYQTGRRAIVGEFSYASHHVQGTLTDEQCLICHEFTQHQQGKVRLFNVDTGGVIELADNANPFTTPTEAAKLEAFCIACHDSDGALTAPIPLQPLADGTTRPLIDATAWSAGSHAQNAATCFGDGSTGCHGNGHGSLKNKLLAPYEVAATAAPNNVEEEEGFCFNCHSSSGSAVDVATYFGTTVRWVTDGAGSQTPPNVNLNDRHDVVYSGIQQVSGAKIECTDCHDPHVANASLRVRSDPDPADGRVPGTGQVLAGADFMTEWCLDCHDGSFRSTVTPPTNILTNIRTVHTSNDTHGAANGNTATLNDTTGWTENITVPCLACHTPHSGARAKRNLFQVKDRPFDPTETTPLEHMIPGARKNDPPIGQGFGYELTDNFIQNDQLNGYQWCNTCHIDSMGSGNKDNCFVCHAHGSGRW